MKRIIALAGNPNCGKTSLFNELTGANQYVGNWPGVTVERKTGSLKEHEEVELLDLPGIYSLSPYSPEEVITRRYLLDEKPDMVIDVVDATNLERNLYLTSQLMETGLPMIVALNMIDLAEQNGAVIDAEALSRRLGCPVIKVSALHQIGLHELVERALGALPAAPTPLSFSPAVEQAIDTLRGKYTCSRLQAVKMLENDAWALEALAAQDRHLIEEQRLNVEQAEDDDISSIIAAGRYDVICKFVEEVQQGRKKEETSFSEKVDRVLTHRVGGLFIFVAIMWAIYYISIDTIGTWGTDWANEVLFGGVVNGWLGGFIGKESASPEALTMFSAILAMCLVFPATLRRLHDLGFNGSWLYLALAPFALEYVFPHMPSALHTGALYGLYLLNALMLLACCTLPGMRQTNKYGSAPVRIGLRPMKQDGRAGRAEYILWLVVMSAVSIGISMLGYVNLDCSAQLNSLVCNGIVAGVGAVLGFLPQMAVLFLLLSLLEDCGYMARVAFMMDRIFRSIGLSGRSFIPLLVSMGCGVPGVMSTRTIENEKDRRMTVMLTTFIPCGAKLPIIALISAVIGKIAISDSVAYYLGPLTTLLGGLIATVAYFAGIGSVILSGLILRKTHMFAGGYTPFVMELPTYHIPRGTNINLRAMERCKAFAQKAGTIIFLASALIWFASNYNWRMEFLNTTEQEDAIEQSMLADVGRQFAPLFTPLGWGDWRPAVATVTGLMAKENVVSTFGVLYAASEENPADDAPQAAAAEPEENANALPYTPALAKCNALSALALVACQLDPAVRAAVPAEDAEPAEEEDEDKKTRGVAKAIRAAGDFSALSALSFMLFNLLCAPCFAACGAIRREMNSARWTWFAIGYMCVWAYAVAFLVYQIGMWVQTGSFATGQLVALALALALVYMILRRNARSTAQ